jgi:hypothetical protein
MTSRQITPLALLVSARIARPPAAPTELPNPRAAVVASGAVVNFGGRGFFRTGRSDRRGRRPVMALITREKQFAPVEPCREPVPAHGGQAAMLGSRNIRKAGSRSAVVLAATLLLAACAAPAGVAMFSAGSGVAMGTGVDYTLNGIAYKTFVTPLPTVRQATLNSLNRMGMKVVEDRKTDSGWTITANAMDRSIDIDLERVTSQTTRMRVVANNGIIFKDRATEAAIIDQTADALDRRGTARAELERPAAEQSV